MVPRTLLRGESGTELSGTTGASSNTPPAETQLQCWHRLVHRDTANAATRNMTLDTRLKIVRITGSSKNKKEHPIRCNCSHIEVHGCQLMIWHTAGECSEQWYQFIAAHNGKPPWLTKAIDRTVCEIEHHEVVRAGIFADEFCDKNPREWTKQALTTLEDATEAYMVEVIAESDM